MGTIAILNTCFLVQNHPRLNLNHSVSTETISVLVSAIIIKCWDTGHPGISAALQRDSEPGGGDTHL